MKKYLIVGLVLLIFAACTPQPDDVEIGLANSYSAQHEMEGDTLSFGPVTSTRMACEQERIGPQEQSYFQALEAAGSYELDGKRLTIWSDDGKVALNFIKA